MKIYHGTQHQNIKGFDFDHIRTQRYLDFGSGVYFTTNFQQAIDWSCKPTGEGAVYECEIDPKQVGLNILEYKENDEDLYYLLCFCRTGLEEIANDVAEGYDDADVIYGLMLDGTIADFRQLAEKFIEGDVTIPEVIAQTKLYECGRDQICVKTETALEVINSGLCKCYLTKEKKVVDCIELKGGEKQ